MTRKTSQPQPTSGRRISRGQIAILVIVLVVLWWRSGSNSPVPASQTLPPDVATVQAPAEPDGDSLIDSLEQTLTEEGSGFEAGSLDAVQTAPEEVNTPVPSATDASGWSAGSLAPAALGVSGLSTVAYADLPKEAKETLRLIHRGGPFPYAQDGVTFENRERLLPAQRRGHYREYTVITPSAGDRGGPPDCGRRGRGVFLHRRPLRQLPGDPAMTSKLDSVLYGPRTPGLYRLSAWVMPSSVQRRVGEEGWHYAYLDGDAIRGKPDFLAALSKAFHFPAYYGHNWDALEECLLDLSWLPAPGYILLFNHPSRFVSTAPDEWTTARLILEEAVAHWHREGAPLFVIFRRAGLSLPGIEWL